MADLTRDYASYNPMKLVPPVIQIGDQVLKLNALTLDDVTQAQGDTYRLLLILHQLGSRDVDPKSLARCLGLRSPAPLWSRIEHLKQAGKITELVRNIA
jgi:hypothetical protein